VVYNFGRVCLSATFESLNVRSSYLHIRGVRVKFVYEGHQVTVSVTRAKKVVNLCSAMKYFHWHLLWLELQNGSLHVAWHFFYGGLNGVNAIFVT